MKKLYLIITCIVGGILATGCARSGAASSAAGTSSSGTSASSSTSEFYISAFYPSSETVATLPSSVTVEFNESNFSSTLLEETGYWYLSCTTGTYYAKSVTVSSAYAFVTLPSVSGLVAGDTCTLEASSALEDNSGYELGGTTSVTYTISSTGPSVESFSPATGSFTTLPTAVEVTFENSEPTSSSVTNVDNWSYVCSSSSTTYYPTTVSYNSGIATVTLPYVTGLSAEEYCTLSLTSSIVDSSGDSVTGSPSVVYTVTETESTPVGYILSPLASDRVFGTMTVSASAYGTGLSPSSISSVEFYLTDASGNDILIGTVASSSSGIYSKSFNTDTVKSGLYTLSILVTNTSGASVTADSVTIEIANHSETDTLADGGSGGSAYSDSAPSGSNLYGLQVYVNGTTLNGIEPVWQTAFGSSVASTYGSLHGTANGTATSLSCSSTTNGRVTGVYGYAGGSANVVQEIGLICETQYDSTTTSKSSSVGSATGTAFELDCPAGTFVVGLLGRSGSRNDQIELVCE